MQTQLVTPISPGYGAPYGRQAYLLPPSQAAAIYEGPWIQLDGVKALSVEFEGSSGATFALDLYGTNDPIVAAVNSYTVTVGGTITNNDTLTLTFLNPNLPNSTEAVTVAVVTADTTTTVAAKLAAAINADTKLDAVGIGASSAVAVVTVTFPSVATDSPPPDGPPSVGGSAGLANFTSIVGSKSGGATETLTVATAVTGTKLNASSIATLGFLVSSTVPFPPFPLFIKARLTAVSGSITASLNAAT